MTVDGEVITDPDIIKLYELWGGDSDCDHEIVSGWSGYKCIKCNGWCCL